MTGERHNSDKHTELSEPEFTGKKKVKQSNHEVYTLPDCMAQWADEPLYLVVARWGLQQKRWIDRNDIAAAFHISDRRATFQLSYISRKKERVSCRIRSVPIEGGRRRRVEIFIDGILPGHEDSQTTAPARRRKVPTKQAGATSRRVGNGMVANIGLWDRLIKGCREGRDDE